MLQHDATVAITK